MASEYNPDIADTSSLKSGESTPSISDNASSEVLIVGTQIAQESGHDIKYKTCSWQRTAALLFSGYICLSILSFPWSFSILGLVPGVIVTLAVAAACLYTSLILGRYCIKHPELRDICDIGQKLFRGSQLAYNLTSLFFVLNNLFIQVLHVLVGTELTGSADCTMIFGVITALICFFVSLPRTLSQMSGLGVFSANHPFGYIPGEEPIVTMIPVEGTTYVAGMSAFLNICRSSNHPFAEMRNPKDFPKGTVMGNDDCRSTVYTLCGALIYHYIGNQYMTSPAFGSLQPTFKKIAYSFAIPTIIYLGSLYSSIIARFTFFRISRNSHHRHSHTVVGWSVWVGIIATTWIIAFVIASAIPFFSEMLSLMSSLFDGWFGFIFWAMAYLSLYPGKERWNGALRSTETLVNYFLILLGYYILIAGTYVSIKSIIDSSRAKMVGPAFTWASNGL